MDPDTLYRTIGTRIGTRRKQLDLTQKELAERIELSRASLANIERGQQKILVHNLYAIAAQLGYSVADLLPHQQVDEDVEGLPFPKGMNPVHRKQLSQLITSVDSGSSSLRQRTDKA